MTSFSYVHMKCNEKKTDKYKSAIQFPLGYKCVPFECSDVIAFIYIYIYRLSLWNNYFFAENATNEKVTRKKLEMVTLFAQIKMSITKLNRTP